MNYLFRYLQSLPDAELPMLAALELSPREQETFDTLVELRAKEATKEEVMERLGMRSTMFDKTCSVLLRKVYAAMTPEGEGALLLELRRRRLPGHFMHEVMRQEKQIQPRTRDNLIAFYRRVFDLLQFNPRVEFDYASSHAIARRLRRLGVSSDVILYLDVSLLKMDIWKAILGSSNPAADRQLLRRLERLQKDMPNADPLTQFTMLRAWAEYYSQISVEVELRRRTLQETIELCRRHPEELGRARLLVCQFSLAEHEYFFGNNFAEAYRMYNELFLAHAAEVKSESYHIIKLIQLCVILGHYTRAEQLLAGRFGRAPEAAARHDFKPAALNWTKLYLSTGEYDEAWRYLDLAFALNRGVRLVQYEIQCRLLRVAWFAMTGKIEQVERLIPATLRYLHSKGYGLNSGSLYPWFVKLVQGIIDERTIGRALSPQLEKKYHDYQYGAAAQYGALLKRMREGRSARSAPVDSTSIRSGARSRDRRKQHG